VHTNSKKAFGRSKNFCSGLRERQKEMEKKPQTRLRDGAT
jgi:hypothetical protein